MLLSHDTDNGYDEDWTTLWDQPLDTVRIFQAPNGMWWWRRVGANKHPIAQSTRSYDGRHKALHHALRVNRKPFIVTADGPTRPEACTPIQPENAPWDPSIA